MNVVYEPKGERRSTRNSYATLLRCVYGCRYCYAFACMRTYLRAPHRLATRGKLHATAYREKIF